MAGKKPDYRVFVTTKNGEKDFFHEVGVGWNVKSGGISVKLFANPTDGSMVMFPPKEENGDGR
jgi:hypothetical protein